MFKREDAEFQDIIQKLENIKAKSENEEELFLLYKLATTDQKTSLYNYRFFKLVLEREIERSVRHNRSFSTLLIDVDNFKKVNSDHGHLKGDMLLERLAKVIEKNVRMNDTAARFGGEEFVVLLPETDERKAWQLAERLRIRMISDQVLGNYDVTVSIGVHCFQGRGNGGAIYRFDPAVSKSVIEKADSALLHAKQTGKNKCVIYSSLVR
ncbi:GGDEF domain-containing protein [Nanoarchaeota archaeon]